jgi:hypothetical protein
MNFTTDQLSYVLERKFIGLIPGRDALLICTAEGPDDRGRYNAIADASIVQWNIPYIPKPTDEELATWWAILEEQYQSDPSRVDSAMYKMVNDVTNTPDKQITINSDI